MTVHVNFKFKWRWKPTDEQLQKLNAIIPDGIKIDENEGWLDSYETYTANIHQLLAITNQFELEQTSPSHILQLSEQIDELIARMNLYSKDQQFNEACNVHITNVGLLTIQKVKIETNMCTDMIQDELDDGWKILAICPQPDQRRPDYVLGKS